MYYTVQFYIFENNILPQSVVRLHVIKSYTAGVRIFPCCVSSETKSHHHNNLIRILLRIPTPYDFGVPSETSVVIVLLY